MENLTLESLASKVAELEERIAKQELLNGNPTGRIINKQLSLKEYILQKLPKDDLQKTLCIMDYYETHKQIESINLHDIEQGFKDAKEKVPEQLSYKLFRNAQKGLIQELPDKKNGLKSYSLTRLGQEAIDKGFVETA